MGTLASSDTEVVGQSLELLQLLFLYRPEVSFGPGTPVLRPLVSPWPLAFLSYSHFSGPGKPVWTPGQNFQLLVGKALFEIEVG